MPTTKVKLSKLKPNDSNPRFIKDEKFEKLCKSIKDFGEKMMPIRPIIVDENWTILGGNMRCKALNELGYKEIPNSWVKQVENLTEKEKKEFIIKDNVGFGNWDYELLANQYDLEDLEEWGLEVISDDDLEDETNIPEASIILKLHYSSEEYDMVKTAIGDIGQTAENILFKALGLEENKF